VVLFSGGIDSFAGTVDELVAHKKSVALVSHRSASKIVGAQKRLVRRLRERLGANRVFHVPVWANLVGGTTRESTYRTRSFLVAALGAVTARLFGLDRITFFENGIVSLNLPPLAQVVGARATRVTHPQVLAGFRRLLSGIVGRCFEVANPYTWLTKAEVIEHISVNGFRDLIRDTRSCAHVRGMTTRHPHCGLCSQCVDRRFAILAAGLEEEDPSEAYNVDLFTGERSAGPGREMALAYVRSASDIKQMTDVEFFSRYGEASRAVGFFEEPPGTVAKRIFDLQRRHAAAVCRIFDQATSAHAAALREGRLPRSCLLSLILG
jgi:7-cyano-7-deazaguanine synthase in queuosine biosynthesis